MKKLKMLMTIAAVVLVAAAGARAQFFARDPGVRVGPAGAGGMLDGLTGLQPDFFTTGLGEFEEADGLAEGLGPRFNLDSCVGCHSQPATGGTSPEVNPQVAVATAFGALNTVPSFITLNGPVREARFKYTPNGTRDGGVHGLFVISGRNDGTADASGCNIQQDNFGAQLAAGNVSFRIPTPTFGSGLIEQIPDWAILANRNANALVKASLGISGHPNQNGNDGTIARFGWKAQNKSLLLFSGEAYNVEMGITNELFQTERDEAPTCQLVTTPNNVTATDGTTLPEGLSAIEKFAFFMRFLAPPTPSPDTPGGADSIGRGRYFFAAVGCALCHTPALRTGHSTVAALDSKPVNLFSDLLVHNMGPGLADDILQGQAGGDEFRTAPLWGLGQRIFFLHDGRTTDLRQALQAHRSFGNLKYQSSEANTVIGLYNSLSESQKQDVLNFLRSL
ncbi:MAG: hypothetical protein AUH09_04005 [Candidatus Rokubacteria bacterium 13_2_20CM_70_12]|nr:MAG: hypothetical protein AUH09_04005 [Candidatus Rokubacteria bacterium 13_2_20CM_70_12]